MYDEGFCDEAIRDKNYVTFAQDIMEGRETLAELQRIIELIEAFALTKTKAELLARGLAEGMLLAPVSDLDDVLSSPQLSSRGYWDEVDGELHPGAIVKASVSPLAALASAPALNAHGDELRNENRPPVVVIGSGTDDSRGRRPLDGLKVCDLSWVAAAPLTTKILAHWGADVVRIESVNRPCLLREALGHRDNITDPENAITWHSANANKRTISLDLSKPEGREVVKDLVAWADVVLDSGNPGSLGVGLRTAPTHQPRPGHGLELRHGADRSLPRLRRLRQHVGIGGRLLRHHRLARSAPGRSVHGLHRLHVTSVHGGRSACSPRLSAANRRRSVSRFLPDGGSHTLPDAGPARSPTRG
jgi:hypothetical protein